MNYEITKKLDRRHAWYGQFAYMIEFKKTRQSFYNRSNQGVLEFDQARRWFNETWGWSQDIETRKDIIQVHRVAKTQAVEVNPHWTWSCRYQEYRIYVNDAALTMFKLKWSNDSNTG